MRQFSPSGAARLEAEAVAATAQADLSSTEALISHLKLEIEKLRRALYGIRSQRKARLLEQIELELEELKAAATEAELAAEKAATKTQAVRSFQRRRPMRKPFPDKERERVVNAAPTIGVTDGFNRLHEIPNVMVVDASCFTTGAEKNPTLTVMALAARSADRLARDLRAM